MSLLSPSPLLKLSTKENMKQFPAGAAQVFQGSQRDPAKYSRLKGLVRYDSQDNIKVGEDYEELVKLLDLQN